MKLLSRDFTRNEKIILLILSIVLVAIFYYWFVDQPVRTTIATAQAQKEALQIELDALNVQIADLQRMEAEMEDMDNSGHISIMGSYNNVENEVDYLDKVLAQADKYSISLANVTRDGDQIRRNFTLQYTARNYNTARKIIDDLANCPMRCLVGNISASHVNRDEFNSMISINTNGTFYETLVGGTPDSGLPEDTSEEQVEETE